MEVPQKMDESNLRRKAEDDLKNAWGENVSNKSSLSEDAREPSNHMFGTWKYFVRKLDHSWANNEIRFADQEGWQSKVVCCIFDRFLKENAR